MSHHTDEPGETGLTAHELEVITLRNELATARQLAQETVRQCETAEAELDDLRRAWAILAEPEESPPLRHAHTATEAAHQFRARLDAARAELAQCRRERDDAVESTRMAVNAAWVGMLKPQPYDVAMRAEIAEHDARARAEALEEAKADMQALKDARLAGLDHVIELEQHIKATNLELRRALELGLNTLSGQNCVLRAYAALESNVAAKGIIKALATTPAQSVAAHAETTEAELAQCRRERDEAKAAMIDGALREAALLTERDEARAQVATLREALLSHCSLHEGVDGLPPHIIDKGEGGGWRERPCELTQLARTALASTATAAEWERRVRAEATQCVSCDDRAPGVAVLCRDCVAEVRDEALANTATAAAGWERKVRAETLEEAKSAIRKHEWWDHDHGDFMGAAVRAIDALATTPARPEATLGCEHGRLPGQPCPHCMGINATARPEAPPCGGSRCHRADDGTWIHSSKSYGTCAVGAGREAKP